MSTCEGLTGIKRSAAMLAAMNPSRRTTLVASVVGVFLVGGCAHGSEKGPSVASIAGGASASASSAPAATHGPQIRLDTSSGEIEAWYATYFLCLKDHGVLVTYEGKTARMGSVDPKEVTPSAKAACASKLPVKPPELSPETNPDYKEQWHQNVKCLQGKGLPIAEDDDGWHYTVRHFDPPANIDTLEHECEMEAFAKKK